MSLFLAPAELYRLTGRKRFIFDRGELDRKPDLTIGDAIDLWLQNNRRKNQRQAASEAKQWEKWRGKLLKDAPEVAGEAIKTWASLRSVPGVTACGTGTAFSTRNVPCASTINRRLMLLKAVCKAMWRQKRIPDNLSGRIQTLREPPHKETYLTRQQVASLAASAPSSTCRTAIWLLAYTGLRASELLALPKPISSARATLSVAQSKSGKPRAVPVPLPAQQHLRALPLALSYWELRKQFIVARKKAGLPATVTLHVLRHTCASWLQRRSRPVHGREDTGAQQPADLH